MREGAGRGTAASRAACRATLSSWKHGKVIMDKLVDCGRNQKISGTLKEV